MIDEETLKHDYVDRKKLIAYLEDAIKSFSHESLGQYRSAFRTVLRVIQRPK